MNSHTKISFHKTCFIFLVAVGLAFSAGVASAQVSCQDAAAWTEAQDELPTTLGDFSDVPEDYRVAAFQALTTEQKTSVWIEHLELLTQEREELTEAQVKEIAAAADLFERPAAYEEKVDEGMLPMALGSFALRLQGEPLVDGNGGYVQVTIPLCNCDVSNFGCARVFCMPTQGCSPYDCSGRW